MHLLIQGLYFLCERKRSDDPLTREKFEERDNREIGVGLEKIIGLADESIENNNITIEEMVELCNQNFSKVDRIMNQKTTIQIFCQINPSEDPEKIKSSNK